MIPCQTKTCTGDEEISHLVAAIVEDASVPVGMLALPRIGVLKQRGSVEAREPVSILGKMRGHPIDDDPDAVLVAMIDQVHQPFGRTVSAGRTKIAQRLVAPARCVRMLGNWQQLNVRKVHLLTVRHQLLGDLMVGEPTVAAVSVLSPTSQVDFVNTDRLSERIGDGSSFQPL